MNQFSDNFLWMRTFENEVFLGGLANGRCNWFLPFHCKKSIKHIFVARVSLTKNLQFREMLQPPNGWQSSLTEKGKLLSNQHAAKFCWRLFLKWRFYFNSYLGLYNGSVSTWEIGKAQYVWEKLNTQIRDVCLAIQIKNNSHFRFRSLFSFQKRLFWPKFSQLARKMSLNQFLLFFFF